MADDRSNSVSEATASAIIPEVLALAGFSQPAPPLIGDRYMFNGAVPRACAGMPLYSLDGATKATIRVMTVAEARSSAATTAAASVEATGTRAVKISTSATRPLFTSDDLRGDVDVGLDRAGRPVRRRGCRGRARSRPSPRRRRASGRARRSGRSRRGGRETATRAAAATVPRQQSEHDPVAHQDALAVEVERRDRLGDRICEPSGRALGGFGRASGQRSPTQARSRRRRAHSAVAPALPPLRGDFGLPPRPSHYWPAAIFRQRGSRPQMISSGSV